MSKREIREVRKAELIARVATRTGQPRRIVRTVVDAFLEEVGDNLAGGRMVKLARFGTFDVRRYPARMGVHPRTGERMPYPEQFAPSFRAGSTLKNRVRNGRGTGGEGQ